MTSTYAHVMHVGHLHEEIGEDFTAYTLDYLKEKIYESFVGAQNGLTLNDWIYNNTDLGTIFHESADLWDEENGSAIDYDSEEYAILVNDFVGSIADTITAGIFEIEKMPEYQSLVNQVNTERENIIDMHFNDDTRGFVTILTLKRGRHE